MSMGVVSAVRTSLTSPQPRATFVDAAAGTFPQMWSSFFHRLDFSLFLESTSTSTDEIFIVNCFLDSFSLLSASPLFFIFLLGGILVFYSRKLSLETRKWAQSCPTTYTYRSKFYCSMKGKRPMLSCLYACTSMKIIIKFLAYLRKNSHYNNGRDEKKCESRLAWAPTSYPTFYEEITKNSLSCFSFFTFYPAQR